MKQLRVFAISLLSCLALATAVLLHLGGATVRLHGMPLGGALGEYTAEVLIGLGGPFVMPPTTAVLAAAR